MIKACSLHRFLPRLLCWLLLVQLVNISIDPPDFKPLHVTGRANTTAVAPDEVETVYELVVESISDTTVPENDTDETDSTAQWLVLYFSKAGYTLPRLTPAPPVHVAQYTAVTPVRFKKPLAPPPKWA